MGLEGVAVERTTEDEGSPQAAHREAGNEGRRLPVAERQARAQALAAAAAVRAAHVGLGPGLVDEDRALAVEGDPIVEPGPSPLEDIGTVSLAGVARLSSRVIARRRKNRRRVTSQVMV